MNEHGLAAPHRILMSAAFVFVPIERLVIPLTLHMPFPGVVTC
jgi:hypothetical protein